MSERRARKCSWVLHKQNGFHFAKCGFQKIMANGMNYTFCPHCGGEIVVENEQEQPNE